MKVLSIGTKQIQSCFYVTQKTTLLVINVVFLKSNTHSRTHMNTHTHTHTHTHIYILVWTPVIFPFSQICKNCYAGGRVRMITAFQKKNRRWYKRKDLKTLVKVPFLSCVAELWGPLFLPFFFHITVLFRRFKYASTLLLVLDLFSSSWCQQTLDC